MPAVVEAPIELVESMADMRFPPGMNTRMQLLMDRNTNGRLTPDERAELASLVEWSEDLSLLRAKALLVLGRRPA